MAYSTQANLNEYLTDTDILRLTDDESKGSINTDRVSAAIAKADTIIDGYCRAQHTVPFSPVPNMIADLSGSLAAYFLWKRRRKGEIDEERENTYTRNIQMLKDINSGKIKLSDDTAFANAGDIFYSNKDSDSKVYTSTELDKF